MGGLRDRLLVGMLSGAIAGIPDTVKNALDYGAGRTDVNYGQVGAGLFYPPNDVGKREAQTAGYLANLATTSLAGVIFTYMLALTGRNNAIVKGMGFGVASWLVIYGLGKKVLLPGRSTRPLAPLHSLTDHLIYGTLLGLLTPLLANESILPHGQNNAGQLPLSASPDMLRPQKAKSGLN